MNPTVSREITSYRYARLYDYIRARNVNLSIVIGRSWLSRGIDLFPFRV